MAKAATDTAQGKKPEFTIEMRKCNQITEIPFDDLAHTLVLTDKDLTISIPVHGLQALLRGGEQSYQKMLDLSQNAWGYYIVTAKTAGNNNMKYHAISNELKTIRVTPEVVSKMGAKATDQKSAADQKTTADANAKPATAPSSKVVDLRKLFCPATIENSSLSIKPKKLSVFNKELNNTETFDHTGLIHEGVIMNELDKGAGAILAAAQSKNTNKINEIVIIDDFITNAAKFPADILRYVNEQNLGDKLGDKIKITCVWLDLKPEMDAGLVIRKATSEEDSYRKEFAPYINIFFAENNKPLTLTVEEYRNKFKEADKLAEIEANKVASEVAKEQAATKTQSGTGKPTPSSINWPQNAGAEAREKIEQSKIQFKPMLIKRDLGTGSAASAAQHPILAEAAKFKNESARVGTEFEAFKAKLGLEKEDKIKMVMGASIQVEFANGDTAMKKVVDLYEAQQKKGASATQDASATNKPAK